MAPISVAQARTWQPLGDGRDAPQIIEVDATASVITVAMEFGRVLNDHEKLASVTSVAVVSGTSLTTANLVVANDNTTAHADLTLTAVTGERKILWTVEASGGDTLTAEGRINLVG